IFRDRMAELSAANFSQATDLADQLSIRFGLAFRTTHRIVGTLVRIADERGVSPSDLTPALLDQAAVEVIGRPLGLDAAALRRALDTRALVGARTLIGGPAAEPMAVQLQSAEEMRGQGVAAVAERRRAIAEAEAALLARARALAAESPPPT